MPNPVVHFEVIGKDGQKLQRFYGQVFEWDIKADNPMQYGMISGGEGGGIGGGIGVVLGIFVNPVVWFLIPMEMQNNLYRPEGEDCPVSPLFGLWFLLPIIGNFIWYLKIQELLNDFWMRRGAPAP